MLANLRPSLRYVAGLVSVVLLKSAIHSSSSSGAMATGPSNPSQEGTMPYRGVQNHYYAGHHHQYHHHPEYHEPDYASADSSSSGPWFESMAGGFAADSNPVQKNYGVAVTDVDNDGELEIIVAGFDGSNLVLKYNHETGQLENLAIDDTASPYYQLRDPRGSAIGVCACDVDGDGREEIYFLNTNNAYSGRKQYTDKLFKWRNGRYEDVLSDRINSNVINQYAGRSVACIDRKGTGRYSIYLSNYANRWVSPPVGPCAMVEMDETQSDVSAGIIKIRNVAREVGVEGFTGGRGVAVGPILNDEGRSDIFCDNEGGPNFLYKNDGSGNFDEVAASSRISDAGENGRGLALADFNGDGKLDIVYGNWNGLGNRVQKNNPKLVEENLRAPEEQLSRPKMLQRSESRTFVFIYDEEEKKSKAVAAPDNLNVDVPVLLRYNLTEEAIEKCLEKPQLGNSPTEDNGVTEDNMNIPAVAADKALALGGKFCPPTERLLRSREKDELKNKGMHVVKWLVNLDHSIEKPLTDS